MEKKYRYKAFISYRHNEEDMKVAEHLHNAIERYHIPKSIRESIGFDGNMDVFRDKYDLPVTDSLNDTIGNALRDSEYLIVICSTHLKESVWVDKEIEIFLRTHPRNNIFTVLVDGEPFEAIPKVLLTEEVEEVTNTGETVIVKRDLEPLSADYRSGIKKAKKTELHRLVAGLLGCTYEDLMLRQQKYRNRVMASVAVGVASLMTIAISYVLWSNTKISDNYRKALYNRSEYLSEESIRVKSEEKNKELAIQLALNAVPDGNNDMPYNPHAQFALSTALDAYTPSSDYAYSGIHYFEGEMNENFSNMASNKDGTMIAAISSSSDLHHQYLYLWDTEKNELIAKHYLYDDFQNVSSIFFSKENLWVISGAGINIYSLSDGELSKEITPVSNDIVNGMATSNLFLNGNRLYSFLGDAIDIYDIDAIEKVSNIKFGMNLKNAMIEDVRVSPDNRYFSVLYAPSSEQGYVQNLAVMDLDSQKIMFDQRAGAEDSAINGICFDHEHILVSRSSQNRQNDGTAVPGFDSFPHTLLKNTVFCFDCASGKKIWEKEISSKQDKPGEYNSFQIQLRHMQIADSDKYKDFVVVLDDNKVLFLEPATGETVQIEELPYSHYRMGTDNTYEDTHVISLYETKNQVLLELCFDGNDSSTNFKTLSIDRPGLTYIDADLENERFFACFGNEIIQYKKDGGDSDSIMLDKEPFYGDITSRLSFSDFMVLLVQNESTEIEQSTERNLRIYDLKRKELFDIVPLTDINSGIIGVAENRYIIFGKSNNGTFYKYDIQAKKLNEIDVSDKLKDKAGDGPYKILDAKMQDDSLLLLIEELTGYEKKIHSVIYHVSKNMIEDNLKKVSLDSLDITNKTVLNNDGTKAYFESYDGTNKIIDFSAGDIHKINDVFEAESKYLYWNGHNIGLYDGKKLLLYDADKKKKIVEIESSDIASFSLTDEYLYYLELDGRITRFSIDNGKSESSLLKKYAKYKEMDLSVLDEYYEGFWHFDDNIIRILSITEGRRTMLEIDRDTLELVGQYSDISTYNKENNSYCVETGDSSSYDTEEQNHRIALFNCYDLNELIEKGKTFTNNKELNKHQKMRYGIE